MSKDLHVALSPLTNKIYCGRINREGTDWVGEKFDVTLEAIGAVAEKVKRDGGGCIIKDKNGKQMYKLIVE